ncbi:MAG: glycogen synthase [Deltaproteobacteria bacterium]|nr:glycogen synthase [Deltaproteobacteria bacterium]
MTPHGDASRFAPSSRLRKVLLVAAEYRGLAKVGGLADVAADLSATLVRKGLDVLVVLPGYPAIPVDSPPLAVLNVPFAGRVFQAALHRTQAGPFVLRNDEFFSRFDSVYVDSSQRGRGPFEDDAQRFAFFCRALSVACESVPLFDGIDVLHCHDWHTGPLVALARLSGTSLKLARSGILLTIHNLDYQGIRPIHGDAHDSYPSFLSWYPDVGPAMLAHPAAKVLYDPRYPHCYNPLRAAIRLSDRVNTVSPTYAREITRSDDPARSFSGGRGLESDLATLSAAGYLSGILNGLDYDAHDPLALDPPFGPDLPAWQTARRQHKAALWHSLSIAEPGIPLPPLDQFLARPLAVSVGRLARQKVSLLLEPVSSADAPGPTVLAELARRDISFLLLGAGELLSPIARAFDDHSRPGLGLLPRFDSALAARLYAAADLFVMPSDFEPCGLSQLISMRFGALPVASAVGGLLDTVTPDRTGFLFRTGTRAESASAFLAALDQALALWRTRPADWKAMQVEAMRARFSWDGAADRYLELYAQTVASRG